MPRQIRIKKSGPSLPDRVDFLREVASALLDEVRTLGQIKSIEVKDGINFDEEIRSFEIELIEQALAQTGGNQLRAAQLLSLKHTTLNAKIKRYAIGIRKYPFMKS